MTGSRAGLCAAGFLSLMLAACQSPEEPDEAVTAGAEAASPTDRCARFARSAFEGLAIDIEMAFQSIQCALNKQSFNTIPVPDLADFHSISDLLNFSKVIASIPHRQIKFQSSNTKCVNFTIKLSIKPDCLGEIPAGALTGKLNLLPQKFLASGMIPRSRANTDR